MGPALPLTRLRHLVDGDRAGLDGHLPICRNAIIPGFAQVQCGPVAAGHMCDQPVDEGAGVGAH